MKPARVVMTLVAIAIAGSAVFVALKFQANVVSNRGPSATQTKAHEWLSGAESLGRDLLGRNSSQLPPATRKALEWVPFGTPLEVARQTMTEHQFVCSLDSYNNPAQMPNSAIWNTPFIKDGQRLTVTNVARLTCNTNGCTLTFWVVNGETTSLSVKGQF